MSSQSENTVKSNFVASAWRWIPGRRSRRAPQNHPNTLAPVLVDPHLDDWHGWVNLSGELRKAAVITELRANEKEQWRQRAQRDARKVTAALKFVPGMVPANSQPIVKALHRQFNVFADFKFQNDQTPFTGYTQNINHPAVTAEEGRNLRINETGVEPWVDQPNIPQEQTFELPLWPRRDSQVSGSQGDAWLRNHLFDRVLQSAPIGLGVDHRWHAQTKSQP